VKARRVPAGTTGLAPALRRYLYFTAAMAGAAVMIVEILGAKMLAPYFGTSHFVWTAQIAVTLVALATGYYAGGLWADRGPQLTRLYWAILGAAVYLGFTVLVARPVANACLDFELALGSLLASTCLFFVPLALLATVGPFLVRMLTSAVSSVGGHVGRLTAIGTLGSFAGTVLIGYVLVPFLPNSTTMLITAGALLAVALGYWLGWGRRRHPIAAACGAVLALALGGMGLAQDRSVDNATFREVFRANSNFGRLQVLDVVGSARRYYLNDYLVQNTYDRDARDSVSTFTYVLHALARGYATKIDNALCIGLGVGIVPMKLAREGVRVDVVEINPAVVPLARQFFALETSRVRVIVDDGRHFANRSTDRYDVVVLDAFLGDSSPSHLMSREAFGALGRLLRPDGVLVINSFGDPMPDRDFFTASLDKTLRSVFRGVRIHASGNGNVFFAASQSDDMRLRSSPDPSTVHPSCRGDVLDAIATVVTTDPAHGIVLTDDYNPAEYYDAVNREIYRRTTAIAMKNL
jgi:spermidine synthase